MADRAGNLSDIPDDISLNFFTKEISLRKKQRGKAFITACYVDALKIYVEKTNKVAVRGEIFPSQRKSDPKRIVNLIIDPQQKLITDAHCKCQQGSDGMCSHAVALVILLEELKVAGYKDVPSMLSCTSLPQQWDKPRGSRIDAEPVSQMVIARPGNVNRKRKPVMANFVDNRIIEVTDLDIISLKKQKSCPISYLVEVTNNDTSHMNTPIGLQVTGSALSYHAPLIQPISQPRSDDGCGDCNFPRHVHIDNESSKLLNDSKHEWSHLTLSFIEAHELERKTQLQSDSPHWHKSRKHRITASVFGKIVHRKKAIDETFIKNTVDPKPFISKPTSYGQVNEKTAKTMFIKKTGAHLHDVGLIVNPDFPFIGASPDAILCKDGKSAILEVKCPYSARDMLLEEATVLVKDFFLKKEGDILSLCRNHNHYFQVQGQLLVSGADYCEFVTYTRKDMHMEKIYPDHAVMKTILHKMCHVFVKNFNPYCKQTS